MTALPVDDRPRDHAHHRHGWWWKTLLVGLALWIVTIVVTILTLNTNLVPTIILIGSFLVPFTVVLFVIERVTGTVSTMQLVVAFFVGGILGVLGASLLEANLRDNVFVYIAVGFVEEFVKGVLLVVMGWRVQPKTARQGALLGATVGAGFAAFESAGYAFNAAITSQGIDLFSLLQTEVIRAVLSPVGHVLWTAVLGAVLFGLAHGRPRFRWSWLAVLAFVIVALLHGLWDSTSGVAQFLALAATGTLGLDPHSLSVAQVQQVNSLTTVFYVIGIIVVSALGVVVLIAVLVHYRRRARAFNGPGSSAPWSFAPMPDGSGYGYGYGSAAQGAQPGQQQAPWHGTPPPHAPR